MARRSKKHVRNYVLIALRKRYGATTKTMHDKRRRIDERIARRECSDSA